MSMTEALEAYKHKPQIEKRFEQLKTVFDLRPVLLQNHMRVEAELTVLEERLSLTSAFH
jgi:transposase